MEAELCRSYLGWEEPLVAEHLQPVRQDEGAEEEQAGPEEDVGDLRAAHSHQMAV